MLDLTQQELAGRINCSLSMLRKIERDSRRPSAQLAELLAEHLAVDGPQRHLFIQMARGKYVPEMPPPDERLQAISPTPAYENEPDAETLTFVGRERELAWLHDQLGQAMAGQGRIVFVSGQAGQGKTTLLFEFARQAQAAWPALLVAAGGNDIYTELGDPLLPFRDIFRLLAGDMENRGSARLLNAEHATRLARGLLAAAKALLDQGPELINTLVSASSLEARLAKNVANDEQSAVLLSRLRERQTRQFLSGKAELRQGRPQDQLFGEISNTLTALSRRWPLLLLLDDLHWVDHSSAGLLAHLVGRIQRNQILIAGSFRPEDLILDRPVKGTATPTTHPLMEILNESQRRFGGNRIDLDQIAPDRGKSFVDAILDTEPNELDAAFRHQLARLTEGHPLFVVELLREMKERGDIKRDDDGRWVESGRLSWEHIPARVEGVIEKRISRLPAERLQALTVASVQGEIFAAEVVAWVLGTDARRLAAQLSSELDRGHRLVEEQGVRHIGARRTAQYRFRHHLFQKYLYERLGDAERMYLHEDVGRAQEELYKSTASAEEFPAAQLARHFRLARLNEKASHYSLLAGQNARRVLAFEEAAEHFEQGLTLLTDRPSTAEIDSQRFELQLALAQAYWHGGRVTEAFTTYTRAIETALELPDPETLARAVLAYEELRWRLNLPAGTSLHVLRQTLARLGEGTSPLQVRLLVSLARALLAAGKQEGLQSMVDQALQLARQIDDRLALYDALRISSQIDRRPEMSKARLAMVQEMIALAKSIGDREREADGLGLYIYELLELGRIDLVDERIAIHAQLANEIKQPFQLHIAAVIQTMRAIMRGEFEEAEQLARTAADLSEQMGIADLDGIYGIHMFTIRRQQGRLGEIAPVVKILEANNPAAVWRPGLALIYASVGLKEECRLVFEELAENGFAAVPRDSLWVASLTYLTEACAFLDDAERASQLYEWLLPYDGRVVVVGGATACYGAAGRFLGILARIMKEWPAAEEHFEEAIALDASMEAWPWLAHSRYEYAEMLFERGRPADRQRAASLLEQALTDSRELGMGSLTNRAATLLTQCRAA